MDKYIENMTDRQAEVELNAEENISEVQDMFSVLLNDPTQRSEYIFDSFVVSAINKAVIDMDADSATKLGLLVAEYMDMSFDELNSVPIFERSMAWEIADSAMITGASEQAKIMSGLTQQSIINGVDNAQDLQEEADKLSTKEIQELSVDIKGTLKRKKDAKRNGK